MREGFEGGTLQRAVGARPAFGGSRVCKLRQAKFSGQSLVASNSCEKVAEIALCDIGALSWLAMQSLPRQKHDGSIALLTSKLRA